MEGNNSIMEIYISIGIAVATIITNIVVSAINNKKSMVLIEYRLKELEEKVNIHNSVIDRTYKVEKDIAVIKEDLYNAKIH